MSARVSDSEGPQKDAKEDLPHAIVAAPHIEEDNALHSPPFTTNTQYQSRNWIWRSLDET
jgi:hypothetical protein